MPIKGGKIYAELSQNIERMADGVEKHKDEKDFPSSIKNASLRESRKQLEDLRQRYEDLLGEARIAYDSYNGTAEKLQKEYAGHKTILEGFYGKKSPFLSDFGLTPWRQGGKRGARKQQE